MEPFSQNSTPDLSLEVLNELLQMENDLQKASISQSITKTQFRSALAYFDILKKFDEELKRTDIQIQEILIRHLATFKKMYF